MKKIIKLTESDLIEIVRQVINESSPILLGCHDYGKIKPYCHTLRLTKGELDTIISQNQPKTKNYLNNEIDVFIKDLIEMGGDKAKIMAKKFSSTIQKLKPSIIDEITKYYSQAVYASGDLQKPTINVGSILTTIVEMIYNEFIKIWNNSWLERQGAKLYVDEDNIDYVKNETRDIWNNITNKFGWLIDGFFSEMAYDPVYDLVGKKNKTTTEKCTSVILTHNEYCDKLKKPVNPYKQYDTGYPVLNAKETGKVTTLMDRKYLPLIFKLLDELV